MALNTHKPSSPSPHPQPFAETDSTKRQLFGCAAAMLSVAFCLLLLEIGLRLLWTPPSARSDQPFGPHPILNAAPLPGASGQIVTWEYEHPFVHNRQGLRASREFSAELPSAFRKRVLFLGDSFTYGLGSPDEETFVERVAAALPDVEVVNSGCNGYGQREELAVVDTLGAALQPDLVVLVFFWNDLEDNTKRTVPAYSLDEKGRVVRTDLAAAALADYNPLHLQEVAEVKKTRKPPSYCVQLMKEGLKGLRYRILGIKARSIQTPEEKENAWEVTEELLRLLHRRVGEIGADLLIVSLPDQNRVDPTARIRGIDPLHFEIEDDLAKICERHGIAFADATEAMREAHAHGTGPLYYYADRHLTSEGNAAFAKALIPRIRERLGE